MYEIDDDLQAKIDEAEEFVTEDSDRIPIRDDLGHGYVHGAIVVGEEPVAFTPQLKATLENELVDGDIQLIISHTNEDPEVGTETNQYLVSPSDDDYIEALENIIQPNFTIDVDEIDN